MLVCVLVVLSSCASRKDVVYFQDTGNFETLVNDNNFVSKFKVDDLVSIHVSSLNPEASAPFNLFRGSSEGGFNAEQIDYLVDQAGEIDFPVVGKLKPIINIRLRNFTVTVLGEVLRPGTYAVNGEQITILEALGLAGDLTLRGVRNNVLVIRDFNGTKVYSRVDLTSKDIIKSPVFYLTQNDVVYVEPNKSGIKETSLDGRASIYLSIASVLITSTVILITRN